MKISDYPFTLAAAEHVREEGYSLEALLDRPHFQPVRSRAVERVRGALEGEIPDRSPDREVEALAELLSYPIARVMVSCADDSNLVRRYALAEAKLAYKRLRREKGDVTSIANDLGLHPEGRGETVRVHFSEYVRAAHGMKSPKWKLVNRDLSGGFLTVTREEMMRLMEEMARIRVLKGLPLDVGDEICSKLSEYMKPLKDEVEAARARQTVYLGKVTEGAFPPCIQAMLNQVASGANLAHSARFALVSFLLRIDMPVDQVMGVFNRSPDFDEERTRYQVEHIGGSSGTKYKPPSCATMKTYGNCPGEDDLCKRVGHPLSYYERRLRSHEPPGKG